MIIPGSVGQMGCKASHEHDDPSLTIACSLPFFPLFLEKEAYGVVQQDSRQLLRQSRTTRIFLRTDRFPHARGYGPWLQ